MQCSDFVAPCQPSGPVSGADLSGRRRLSMKYVVLIILLLLTGVLVLQWAGTEKGRQELTALAPRLKALGGRFHRAVGIVAVIILVLLAVRMLVIVAKLWLP
jgi:hypothetical protein